MQARCPFCQNVFSAAHSGVQFCPTCGKQLNVPEPAASAPSPAPQGAFCPRHPERLAIGACTRCGTYGCEECLVGGLCPTCRPQGVSVGREPTPWERRGQLGLFNGLVETVKRSSMAPAQFFASVDPKGSAFDAFLYGWVLTTFGAAMTFLVSLVQLGGYRAMLENLLTTGRQLDPEMERMVEWLMDHPGMLGTGAFFSTVLFYPLSFLILSAIIHLGCLAFGAAKNGFGATARVVGYSSAPALLGWIPVIGGLFSMLFIPLWIVGVHKVQESTVGRAVGGVVLLPFLLLCCLCGSVASLAGVALSKFKAAT